MGDYNRVSEGYKVDLLSQKGLQVEVLPESEIVRWAGATIVAVALAYFFTESRLCTMV